MTASSRRSDSKTTSYDAPRTPISGRRHRIRTARGEGTASQDPPDAQGSPLQDAVPADRLERVGGARRVEAAPADQQPPDRPSVQEDQPEEGPAHGGSHQPKHPVQRISPASANTRPISSISSVAFESPKGPRATRTRSYPSATPGHSARQASRSRRRARLRATAPPTRFPVTQAAREGPGLGATYTITRSDLCGVPSRRARRMAGVSNESDAESRSALLATAAEDRPARARAHPGAEAVSPLPPASARLISALHEANKVTKESPEHVTRRSPTVFHRRPRFGSPKVAGI